MPIAAVTTQLVLQHAIDAISLGSLYALFALGIALIFGIMRLINFAHGELVMGGAFVLVLLPFSDALLIAAALAIVVALALAVERIAFRPVRNASPATLLITSFALSFLLQNVAALLWGSTPRTTDFAAALGETVEVGSLSIQKLDVVIVGVTLASLLCLGWLLRGTSIGRQMRAAAEDFRMARILGVRANTVIAFAFALSGVLAGIAAVLLTAQTGTVSPTLGVNVVLFAFIATIVGGMGSLPGAVVGGFAIGAITVVLQAALPIELRPYRDAVVFGAVLAVLVIRPQGLLPAPSAAARELPRRARLRGAFDQARRGREHKKTGSADPGLGRRTRRAMLTETIWPPAALIALTCVVTYVALLGPDSLDRVAVGMVLNVIVVVGLYMFVGLSGVFSFGHAAFMAIGAYAGAILVIPPETKEFVLPDLPGALAGVYLDPLPATLAAGAISAGVALLLAVPLARLSGLTAGLATFAVLVIVNVVAKNWQQVTHGTAGVTGIPTSTTVDVALAWALVAIVAAWALQRSAIGLRLRASREQETAARALGIAVGAERAVAFVASAFFVGVAGALLGMFIGSFNPDAFFLNITFLMVVMLVIGGVGSLAGAVVGTIAISVGAELLRRVEGGVDLGFAELPSRPGLREVGLAVLMLVILIRKPSGLTGGHELAWPGRRRREM
jgi:branched-chain amino acid transport system permease protein